MNSANEEKYSEDEISVNNDSDRNLKSHGERQIDKCPRPGKIYFTVAGESIAFVPMYLCLTYRHFSGNLRSME